MINFNSLFSAAQPLKLLLKLIVLFFIFTFALAMLLPSFVNQTALKNNLQIVLDKNIDGDLTINGGVTVNIFPLPELLIEDVEIKNIPYSGNIANFLVKRISIRPSFLSLFSDKIKISKLTLSYPAIDLEFVDPNSKFKSKDEAIETVEPAPEVKKLVYDNSEVITKILNFNNETNKVFDFKQVKNIQIIDGYFKRIGLGGEIVFDSNTINLIVKNITKDNAISVNGDLLVNEIPTHIEMFLDIDNNQDSKMVVNSPIFSLEMNGKFSNSNINDLIKSSFSGKIKTTIANPKEFFNKYLSKYILIYGRVNSVAPVEISAEVESKKGDYKITNLKVASQMITGSGYINANLSSRNAVIESKLNIKNADIDSIWSSRFTNSSSEIIDFERSIMEDFINDKAINLDRTVIIDDYKDDIKEEPLFDSIKLSMAIKAQEAKYSEKFLKDIDIVLSISDNNYLQIEKANMTIPDGGKMSLSGSFKNKNNISTFTGSYKIEGRDFYNFLSWMDLGLPSLRNVTNLRYGLSGEIIILPNFSALKDLTITIGSANVIKGYVKYDNSQDLQELTTSLDIDKMVLDDYFDVSFERNAYVSPGSLSNKFLWLNTIGTKNEVLIKVGELKYGNHTFNDQKINFGFGPGTFYIKDLLLKSADEAINIAGNVAVDMKLKPKIDLDLTFNNFKYDSSTFEDNKQYKRLPLQDRFFFLPNFADFDGTIKLKSPKLIIDSLEISGINLQGALQSGVWKVKDGTFKVYGGELKYNGEVGLKNIKYINGSLVFTGIDNGPFLLDMVGLKTVSGTSNLSGVINAYGTNPESFVKSLKAKAQFASVNVNVSNFGLAELIKRMFLVTYNKITLTRPDAILFSKQFSTNFSGASGVIEIGSENGVKITSKTTGANSVTTGSLDLSAKTFNGFSTIIFLTGTATKQIPINIAISHRGNLGNLRKNANLEQIDEYLKQLKEIQNNEQQ